MNKTGIEKEEGREGNKRRAWKIEMKKNYVAQLDKASWLKAYF